MLLSIDIGNTNITMGVFDNEQIIDTFRLDSNKTFSKNEYKKLFSCIEQKYKITDCIIGSVVEELNLIIKETCDEMFGTDSLLLTHENFRMPILLQNPTEVGADRIANAYATIQKYKLPAIVVDIGTATTFDIVSKNGEFLGGVIMPGLNLQLKSLNSNTSKLPNIKATVSEKPIGDSTEKAILSGVIRGSASAIEGLINQCELELGEKTTIIATGGHSKLISEYMIRQFDYINPNLTLEGLKLLYKANRYCKL